MISQTKSKIKILILSLLMVITIVIVAITTDSAIRELKNKKFEIESVNFNLSTAILVSSRIEDLSDRISLSLIDGRDFSNDSSQMQFLNDGLILFSDSDKKRIEDLMNMRMDNIRIYKEDSGLFSNFKHYYRSNITINSEIRKITKKSISESITNNEKKLNGFIKEYDRILYFYIIIGILLFLLSLFFGYLLLNDIVKIYNSNNRLTTTINNLISYMLSK